MAEVYLARDGHLRRDVALKVLKARLAEDEDFLERFRREARSAATLNHPNVVQVYDQRLSEDGRHYIAMEYVGGGTLKERIGREGALDPDEAARVASRVAEALGVAHEAGVVHRDVKSQNVLLSAAGDVKVADFGIARAADTTTLSGPGLILGTAKYMSPEQATGLVATPRSDLYSLGVVFYEMLTGGLPFEANTPADVRASQATGPPRPSDANPGVPGAMDVLVARLMATDPERRLGSAAEVVEELRRVRDRSRNGSRPVAAAGPPAARPAALAPSVPRAAGSRPRRPLRLLASLAALVLVLGAVGWGFGARDTFGEAVRNVLGRQEVAVPDVEGLTESAARRRLSAEGLGARVRPRESTEARSGKVLEQSVPGGREVEQGSRILLAVGEGPPAESTQGEEQSGGVPDLTGLTYPEAEATLQRAGFVLGGVKEVPSETAPAGVILNQDPEAGRSAPAGTPVFLTTSTGRAAGPTSVSAAATASPTAPASTAPP